MTIWWTGSFFTFTRKQAVIVNGCRIAYLSNYLMIFRSCKFKKVARNSRSPRNLNNLHWRSLKQASKHLPLRMLKQMMITLQMTMTTTWMTSMISMTCFQTDRNRRTKSQHNKTNTQLINSRNRPVSEPNNKLKQKLLTTWRRLQWPRSNQVMKMTTGMSLQIRWLVNRMS